MTNLKQLQNNFIDAIYDDKNEILGAIKVKKIAAQELLKIYKNNLYQNLYNCLKITFIDVFNFLKEEKFREISYNFIKNNRSKSGNLDHYGFEFPQFLQDQFLHDLAKLNWLQQESYLAQNGTEIDTSALQNLEPEKLFDIRFKKARHAFLLKSQYNLLAKKDRQKPRKNKCYFLIFRDFGDVKTLKITKKEFQFLQGTSQNMTLYEIYEKYNCDIQICLQKYISNRVLDSIN